MTSHPGGWWTASMWRSSHRQCPSAFRATAASRFARQFCSATSSWCTAGGNPCRPLRPSHKSPSRAAWRRSGSGQTSANALTMRGNCRLRFCGRSVAGRASNQSIARPVNARSVGTFRRRTFSQCSGGTTAATSNGESDPVSRIRRASSKSVSSNSNPSSCHKGEGKRTASSVDPSMRVPNPVRNCEQRLPPSKSRLGVQRDEARNPSRS